MTTFCVVVPGRTAWRRLSAAELWVSIGSSSPAFLHSGFVPRATPPIPAISVPFGATIPRRHARDSNRLQRRHGCNPLRLRPFVAMLQPMTTVRHSHQHEHFVCTRDDLSQLY